MDDHRLVVNEPESMRFQVHRSTLVNVEQIREARVRTHGEHELVLRDGSRLKVSRQRWAEVNALLRKWGKGSVPTA